MGAEEMQEALGELLAAGDIEKDVVKTGGRDVTQYRRVAKEEEAII